MYDAATVDSGVNLCGPLLVTVKMFYLFGASLCLFWMVLDKSLTSRQFVTKLVAVL